MPPEARIATVLPEAGSEADDENFMLGILYFLFYKLNNKHPMERT